MNAATLAAITARLGFRPQDVADELGMDPRRFRRIRTGKYPVPDWLADTVRGWAQEVDADAAATAAQHRTTYRQTPTPTPITLTRYPAKRVLAHHETGIKARSVETWDAYLALVMLDLDAAEIPYHLTTRS